MGGRIGRGGGGGVVREDEDEAVPGGARGVVQRDAEMLDVLQRVRRDDGVEGAIAERQLLDVRVAPAHVGMGPAAAGLYGDVTTDDVVLGRESLTHVAEPTRDVEHVPALDRA